MSGRVRVGDANELGPGSVCGAGPWAVVNADGRRHAVSRRCRHLGADLAEGHLDEDGCLVCPWHGARYELETGRMVQGPGGAFARIPGLGVFFRALTLVLPLGRGRVTERDGQVYVSD
jgi:3-phenylpropionate/trans-cinnamate dioxygenase ferredoxin component